MAEGATAAGAGGTVIRGVACLPARPGRGLPWRASLLALALSLAPILPIQGWPDAAARAQATSGEADALVADLTRLLALDALIEVIAQEGRDHGADFGEAFLSERGRLRWEVRLGGIYDPARMLASFQAALREAVAADPAALAPAVAYLGGAGAQRIVALELEARRSLLDPDLTEAAEVAAEKAATARDPKLRQIRRIMEAGGLLEQNVAAGLSGRLAFETGLNDEAPEVGRDPPEVLFERVTAGEAETRAELASWLVSWMLLSYAPLSEAELSAHAEWMATPGAAALNAALFAAFDQVMVPLLREVGREAGRALNGNEI